MRWSSRCDSGGGLHPYWLFREPLDVRYQPTVGQRDTIKEDNDGALRQLTGVFAGDPASCDITRVLRLLGNLFNAPDKKQRQARCRG